MAQYNQLNYRETAGAGARDRALIDSTKQRNALAERNTVAREETAALAGQKYTREQQMQNQRRLAGSAQYMLELYDNDPQEFARSAPLVGQELQKAGILGPQADFSNLPTRENLEDMYNQSMVAIGGKPPEQRKPTTGIKDYEYGLQNPGFVEYQRNSKVPLVSINNPPSPKTGYQNNYDDEGRLVSQSVIPGGPAEQAQQAEQEAAAQKQIATAGRGGLMSDEIERSFRLIGPQAGGLPSTGAAGQVFANTPVVGGMTNAGQLTQLFGTLKGQIGVNELQKMRDSSKTGGAMGALNEQELIMLQNLQGAININAPQHVIAYNLSRLYNGIQDVVHGPGNGGGYMRAPERAYQKLYDSVGEPDYLNTVGAFEAKFGYIPPGFKEQPEPF